MNKTRKPKLPGIYSFLDKRFSIFYGSQIEILKKLHLKILLKDIENPYLLRVKNEVFVSDLIRSMLDVHLSPLQDDFFDDLLKGLAIFICEKVYGGKKSSAEGIDLEFVKDNIHCIVAIKSGPNWGNSQQIIKMKDNFRKVKRILRTSNSKINVQAINGCCYGRDNKPDKGDYFKYCGQRFWELISGNENLYTEIIEPLGHKAKERNEEFVVAYAQIINKFTLDFMNEFCIDGKVDWKKLVKFNSGKEKFERNK